MPRPGPLARLPAAQVDIVDRLEEGWMEGKADDFHMEAAAEIRRLRALVPLDRRRPGV